MVVRQYQEELHYLEKLTDHSWRIKKGFQPNMKVESILYVNSTLEKLMLEELRNSCRPGQIGGFLSGVKQIANVAALPGIVERSVGLPDVHSGYGFAIAFDINDPKSIVSPGGAGFDIDCGLRLLRTNLFEKDVQPFKEPIAQSMSVGIGSKGIIPMKAQDLEEALEMGMDWPLRKGYSWAEDKEHCEEYEKMLDADPSKSSTRAKKRGLPQSLRCRSGNEKLSDEYKKIMQTCRRRYGESRDDDNSSTDDSNDSEDDSSSSDGSVFGHDFFSGSKRNENNNNEQFNNTRRMGDQSYRNYRQYKRNTDIRNYHATSMNNSTQTRSTRNRDYQYGIQNDNNSRNSNNGDQQSCRSHCFFNELNVVDRRGYPERISVTRVMTQGIKDPALRDFIEESLLECFHFLTSTMNLDKCSFSHYLLNCLTDKGKQECEDWND